MYSRTGAPPRVPEDALEVRRRLVEEPRQALAAASRLVLQRRRLLVFECDAESVREPFDRLGEIEVLRLLDEPDDVAALPAAEAVVELVDGVDGEARRSLFVERAAPRVAVALQRGARAGDDVDDVGGRLHLGDARVLDPRHGPSLLARRPSAYARANRSVIPAT